MMSILAEGANFFSGLHQGEFENFLLRIGALLAIGVLVLTFVHRWKEVFGRKPPIDEEMQQHNKTIEKIKEELAELAPNEKLEALIEKLGSFATLTQLAEVRLNSEQNAKDTRAYAHDAVHTLRNEINARMIAADEAREGMHDRIGVLIEATSEIRGGLNMLLQQRGAK